MYLSLICKTNQFNYQIKNTINSYNKDLDIELKEISLNLILSNLCLLKT